MFDITVTERCHRILAEYIKEGDVAVDCTAGNGHDTLFLARAVGDAGKVYAFDVQESAIANTAALLHENGISYGIADLQNAPSETGLCPVVLIQDTHALLADYFLALCPGPARPSVIMYNLGYMPGGEHRTTTTGEDTIKSIEAALSILAPGGVISIIAYPGHDEGRRETEAVSALLGSLPPSRFEVLTIDQHNRTNAPIHFLVKG